MEREQWKRTKGSRTTTCVECGEAPPIKGRRLCRRCKALQEDERRAAMMGKQPGPCSVADCEGLRVVWASQISSYCRAHGALKRRAANVKYAYGLSQQDVIELMRVADERCQICQSSVKLVIDHCHVGGQVRGVLCGPCNTGLGSFKDDPVRLRAAATYLER